MDAATPLPVYALAIRELRNRLGWSRRQLAKRGGWCKSTVVQWELGYNPPGKTAQAVLVRLMKAARDMVPQSESGEMVTCPGCREQYPVGRLCPKCKCYLPSVDEIAAACEVFQSQWTAAEKVKHSRHTAPEEWEVPSIHRFGGRRLRDREDSHGTD